MVIPLSCPPDATHVPYKSPIEVRAAYMPDFDTSAAVGLNGFAVGGMLPGYGWGIYSGAGTELPGVNPNGERR